VPPGQMLTSPMPASRVLISSMQPSMQRVSRE
jgi:hypothetical protein